MAAELSHEKPILVPPSEGLVGTSVELLLVGGEQHETPTSVLKGNVPMLGAMIARKFETDKSMGAEARKAARLDARTASVSLLFKTYGLIEPGAVAAAKFVTEYQATEKSPAMEERRRILDLGDTFEEHPTQLVFDFMMWQTDDSVLRENLILMRKASLLMLEDNSAG